MEASDPCPSSCRLFVTDRDTKTQYLVDTGADLCVFPRAVTRGRRPKTSYELYAANDSTIATYGFETLTLNLGLRHAYSWRFVITDVTKPIIGVDFLHHYGLLIDIRNQKLIDSLTTLSVQGKVSECDTSLLSIRAISGSSPCHKILQEYPKITQPNGFIVEPKHSTKHYINTTSGPPVSEGPRRLAPDKLKLAKQEFQTMQEMKIARTSNSNWSSPLHMVPKSEGNGDLAEIIGDSTHGPSRIGTQYPTSEISPNLYTERRSSQQLTL
ncbi:uncharacterized protein LOC117180584 [Belonocnema kinseyi]|uniref:uncharacterized protein LOC117180584 n=1 Tax=Belonocnema kinseyi TaxID=2817044 RepID=UPI00143D332E|nr:uncharacterized protein LOC117180584 [Belonocnema kinseyi]